MACRARSGYFGKYVCALVVFAYLGSIWGVFGRYWGGIQAVWVHEEVTEEGYFGDIEMDHC